MTYRYSVAILYPSPRSVAYSSLAFHLLKGYLSEAGVGVKAVFLEDGELVVHGKGGLEEVRAVFVSLPFELMYVDLVKALDLMGLEPFRKNRGEGDPIIVAGGPAVTANPLPVLDIVDAVLVGEAEPVLEYIVEALSEPSKRLRLKTLSKLPGVLVNEYSELPVRRVYANNLDSTWYPLDQKPLDSVEPVWGRTFILETTRGCGRSCRFCMEGTIFRPKRDRSLRKLRELLWDGVRINRVGKVTFYSLVFFDNRASDEILREAVESGLEVSVPSLRAESLTFERARMIASGGQRTVTIAPETGSCVVAKAILKPIGKNLTLWAVENAVEAGIKSVKLYLITGFPGETMDDVKATLDMALEVGEVLRSSGARLKVSINPFMPKPVTGMQWAGMENLKTLRRKIEALSTPLRRAGAQVSGYDVKWARAEVLLARGGREVSRLVVAWARRGGSLGALRAALRDTGLREEDYLSEIPEDVDPPWHAYVEHPYAELWRLRRDWRIYRSVVESRGRTSRLRIKGCDF